MGIRSVVLTLGYLCDFICQSPLLWAHLFQLFMQYGHDTNWKYGFNYCRPNKSQTSFCAKSFLGFCTDKSSAGKDTLCAVAFLHSG